MLWVRSRILVEPLTRRDGITEMKRVACEENSRRLYLFFSFLWSFSPLSSLSLSEDVSFVARAFRSGRATRTRGVKRRVLMCDLGLRTCVARRREFAAHPWLCRENNNRFKKVGAARVYCTGKRDSLKVETTMKSATPTVGPSLEAFNLSFISCGQSTQPSPEYCISPIDRLNHLTNTDQAPRSSKVFCRHNEKARRTLCHEMGKGGGGHGGLNILPQKSWNVYGHKQRQKVQRDEQNAAEEENAALDTRLQGLRRGYIYFCFFFLSFLFPSSPSSPSSPRLVPAAVSVQRADSSVSPFSGSTAFASATLRDVRLAELRERASDRRRGEGLEDRLPSEHINFFAEEEEALAARQKAKDAETKESRDESSRLGYGASTPSPWYAQKGSSFFREITPRVDNLPARVRREKEEIVALRRTQLCTTTDANTQLCTTTEKTKTQLCIATSGVDRERRHQRRRDDTGKDGERATHSKKEKKREREKERRGDGEGEREGKSKKHKKEAKETKRKDSSGGGGGKVGGSKSILELRKERMLREQAERRKERVIVGAGGSIR